MKLRMGASKSSVFSEMLPFFFPKFTYEVGVSKEQAHRSVTCKVKRSIDILGALLGLAITAAVAVPLTVAMLFDNPGPLLYSHVRCGLKGQHFRMWKFRSMVVDADNLKHLVTNEAKGPTFKNDNDPRVTRVGRFLRSSSLDELPQFWNVLVGDMSLVGTRPPISNEVAGYEDNHWQRLDVKPGLTGEWQVHGRSGVKDFDDILQMDLDYQRKWSVVYDITLICQTIFVVLSKNGAC
jgi:lipopolysaccharide/colanic/teichoic acid biosynthesis glycosyltransferase